MTTQATTAQPAAPPPTLPPVSSGGEHRLRSENLAFDIDVWYPPLAEHTFSTVFLPLTRFDAEAIVAYYNKVHRRVDKNHGFTDQVVDRLKSLEARIDTVLQREDSSFAKHGAFLRLCGRSPKDGEPTDPVLRAKIWESYCDALERVEKEEEEEAMAQNEPDEHFDDIHGNARIAAISHTMSTLRVTSGSQAMSLLLTSERVFSDMLDWLHYGEPEQVVLRQFCDSFDLSTEFRCYVREGGVLVGISQYDTYAKHLFLQDASQRAVVVQAVVKEWIKVKDSIETIDGSYCVDFGVDMLHKRALLIELGPFRRCTGPALFVWNKTIQDHEGAEILFPDRPDVRDDGILSLLLSVPNYAQYEQCIAKEAILRVRTKAIPGIGDLVEMNWDYRWSKARHDTPQPYADAYASALPTTKPKKTIMNHLQGCFQKPPAEKQHILFVYGTLKRNCHWHGKYMMGAHFLGNGTTKAPYSLVIGACGVPYLLPTSNHNSTIINGKQTSEKHQQEKAKQVKGELWRISNEMLRGIDDYEGIQKGHYTRQAIDVIVVDQDSHKTGNTTGSSREQDMRIQTAHCYFYAFKPGESKVDASLVQAERISEYTPGEQRKQYKPIHHIQVKQLQYLGEHSST